MGVISQVGPNWATVTTLIDPGISIGASVVETGDAAVLTGDLDHMSQGTCTLSYLASSAGLEAGDQVVTSGLGGVYPSGILVGEVTEQGYTCLLYTSPDPRCPAPGRRCRWPPAPGPSRP